MREQKGNWKLIKRRPLALLLATALFAGILASGGTPIGRDALVSAAETTAPADGYRPKNPVVEWLASPNTSHGLSSPRNENGTVTWDCVYFGNYWQSDTNGNGKVDKNDEKEPIKWRVLSVDEDDAFLLADQNLDCQEYNDNWIGVRWETCTMRSWLNGYGATSNKDGKDYSADNFLDNAFNASEQAAIKNTTVSNEDNPYYGTEGGNITTDKVYLLSLSEVLTPSYGFHSDPDKDLESRRTKNTAYAKEQGVWTDTSGEYAGNGSWWLRSPGRSSDYASYVNGNGYVNKYGDYVGNYNIAVRPALHLNLSSSEWKKAETVSATGGEITAASWDCIWFGNYWQEDTNSDGKADKSDAKTPIKWRVLSVNGDDAFLLADKNLDMQKYNNTYVDVTWETCTMRSWLNGYGVGANVCETDYSDNNFLDNAFNASEQAAIKNMTVSNEDNAKYGTEGGNNTTDKLYLLSLSEVLNPSYGFHSELAEYAESRRAKNTAYAKEQGAYTNTNTEYAGNGNWWLRSPGYDSCGASDVNYSGNVRKNGYSVGSSDNAVRPALHLNLSSAEWTYAGTVSSTGEENELPAPNSPASATQTANPQGTPPAVQPPAPGSGTGTNPPASATQTTKPQDTSLAAPASDSSAGTTATAAPTASPEQSVQPQATASPKAKVGKVSGLKVTAKKKAVQASWKKVSGADGYEVQVSTSKKFTKNSVKTTKKTKLTINKLKAKKKYFVRVRAYRVTRGKKTYGKWSKTASGKTKA